jgi:hypothetical protein
MENDGHRFSGSEIVQQALATVAVLSRLTTALNEPINTVADHKDRKTGSNDRRGRTTNSPTLAITILVITTLMVTGVGQIRNTEHQSTRKH